MKNESGLIPTGTRLVVCPQKVERSTASGLVLPDVTVEAETLAATRGIVIAIGEDAPKLPEMRGVAVGDTIMFAKYAGSAVQFRRNGVPYRVIDGRDVLGKAEIEFDSQFQAARSPVEAGGVQEIVSTEAGS